MHLDQPRRQIGAKIFFLIQFVLRLPLRKIAIDRKPRAAGTKAQIKLQCGQQRFKLGGEQRRSLDIRERYDQA